MGKEGYEIDLSETLLIGIGAQKAGTTWLAEYLRDHQPSVHLPLVKEVHFFDNYCMPNYGSFFEQQRLDNFKARTQGLALEDIKNNAAHAELHAQYRRFHAVTSPDAYLDFLRHDAKEGSILCDMTPDYALLDPSGFEFMKSVHDNIKLVFLLRNPADRYWSSLRFNKTHNPDFDVDGNFNVFLGRQDFVRFANYDRTVRVVHEVFGEDRLHLEFYENLFSDNTVKRFCNWLGVPFVTGNYDLKSNAAIQADMTVERRRQVVTAYQQTYREIAARFGDDLPENWRLDMENYL